MDVGRYLEVTVVAAAVVVAVAASFAVDPAASFVAFVEVGPFVAAEPFVVIEPFAAAAAAFAEAGPSAEACFAGSVVVPSGNVEASAASWLAVVEYVVAVPTFVVAVVP